MMQVMLKGGKDLREAKGDELGEKDLGRKGGERSLGGKRRRTEGGKRPYQKKKRLKQMISTGN